jgi:hypothetical protein
VKSILRRRPSPALVVALIALFVSLSGVAYGVATGSIDSREIKQNTIRSGDVRNNDLRTRDLRNNEVRGLDIRNSTVQGRDVALNTLTGNDINESRLGKVPSATSADTATSATSATSAGNASTVGGLTVRKFFAKQPINTPSTEIFRGDTFIIRAGCNAGAAPDLQIDGLPGAPPTNLTVQGTAGGPPDTAFHLNDAILSPGENQSLLGAGPTAAGTAVVSTTDGRLATIVFAADGASAFAGENVCASRGTVTSG